MLKEYPEKYTTTDGGVGKIENGPEKLKILSAPKRKPLRKKTIEKREIKHVDHFAMKKCRITTIGRQKFSYKTVFTGAKQKTIQNRIDDVSNGTCDNQ